MPINPNIALQVQQPNFMMPAQLMSLQALSRQSQLGQLQIEDTLQARDEKSQLKSLFKDPSLIDVNTGTVSLEGIQKAYGISPSVGATLSSQRGKSLKEVAELRKLDTENKASTAKYLRDRLASVTDQASYDAWRMEASQATPQAAGQIPAVFDPAWQRKNVMDADKFIAQNTPKIEMKDVGGQLVPVDVNPNTNPAIKGTVLEKTTTPGEKLSAETTKRGQNLADARAREVAGVTAAKTKNEQENKMRDDFTSASKEFVKVRDAHQRVLESAVDPSAAGDLALIFNYMKVLDPGSTVREGEFATAQNSGGIPDIIRAKYNKVISGERLAPDVRKDFLDRSERLYKGAISNQEKIEKDFEEKAVRAGVRPEQVVTRHRVTQKEKKIEEQPLSPTEQDELKRLRAKYIK